MDPSTVGPTGPTVDPDLPRPDGNTFQWSDFLIFGVFLAANLGVGLYQGLKPECAKKKVEETAQDVLVGGRNMSVFPVAVSILSAFLSAILILGNPAEIYQEGTMYWMYVWGMMLSCLFATLLFVPLLYPLKLTSSYEYLERRFNHIGPKIVGDIILILMQLLYIGVALFSPATALEAVTGFPVWASIIIGGIVAIIYTALGGMKASVYVSLFQCAIMAAGVIAVIIKGSVDMGGMGNIWQRSWEGGRINFFDFNTDPLQRHSFWTLIVGGTVGWLSTYGVNQAAVQRYSSVPTLRAARTVVLLNIPGLFIFVTLVGLCGLVVFAWYDQVGCDPLRAGYIKNSNQILPFYVMDRLRYPCVPGIFLACLFAGGLSSVSSSLGALSAVVWQDMLKYCCGKKSNRTQTAIIKVLVVLFGAAGIGFAFMAEQLGGTVLQASLSFTGAAGGPLLGLFLLGGIFPCANWIGAVVGGVLGLAFPLWISIGSYTSGFVRPVLNTTIDQCIRVEYQPPFNGTLKTPDTVTGLERLYLVSYLWYPSIGAATVVVVGLLISWFTGCHDPAQVLPKYHLPFFDRLFCCCPMKSNHILRCKIAKYNPSDDEEDETITADDAAMMAEDGKVNSGFVADGKFGELADVEVYAGPAEVLPVKVGALGSQPPADHKAAPEPGAYSDGPLSGVTESKADHSSATANGAGGDKPVVAPVSVPVAAPVSVPVAAPVSVPQVTPVSLPVVAPVSVPVVAPVSVPVAAPVSVPVAAPVSVPVEAPVSVPWAAPAARPAPEEHEMKELPPPYLGPVDTVPEAASPVRMSTASVFLAAVPDPDPQAAPQPPTHSPPTGDQANSPTNTTANNNTVNNPLYANADSSDDPITDNGLVQFEYVERL